MTHKHIRSLLACTAFIWAFGAQAQAMYFDDAEVAEEIEEVPDSIKYLPRDLDQLHAYLDSISIFESYRMPPTKPLPGYFFRPAVYDEYRFPDTTKVTTPLYTDSEALLWIDQEQAVKERMDRLNYYLFFNHPDVVRYNIELLPEAPKRYTAVVDPQKHTIVIEETGTLTPSATTLQTAEVKKKHWINTFNSSLQFSQAYVSPNWYQGGNNNVNVLGNLYYNVKLNKAYHPNLLFETTAQYKLGLNNAPDDQVHDYNITDDLFQLNTTFGLKAAKRWYYSFNAQFKTQIFDYYPSNSTALKSAFMSPGELTAGLGMTYNYANKASTVTFDASIAPLSYSYKTCLNKGLDPEAFNITNGTRHSNSFGSSVEMKFYWKLSYNIYYRSRVFCFTDYDQIYGDWENTLSFEINRFLTTQLYVHARYDSKTPKCADENWKKLQVKEIFSLGFAYKFSSI